LSALALDLDGVLGDTRPLWLDWVTDVSRRTRVELDLPWDRAEAAQVLDETMGNWQALLERFAEDRAPVHFRPDAKVSAALRRLQADGVRIGVFTDAPEALARIALAHYGAERRIEALETGPNARERLLDRLGAGTSTVLTKEELIAAAEVVS
jgi:phosphoglycolate phosphatase-like HAD superfamily hydrolase